LKRAQELYAENKWNKALIVLHIGLQNRKTKQNMIILEKLITLMIDICADNLTTLYLKDDIGYFRN
jgi:translation initiation factor 3 subunit A